MSAMLMVADPHEKKIGHRISDFLKIARWLREIGLSAPEIYDVDEAAGFVLMQDLGMTDFKTAMAKGEDKSKLYGLAHDVLKFLSDQKPDFELPPYYESEIHHGHMQIMDWYVPAVRKRQNEDGLREEYWNLWEGIEKSLPPCPQGFQHIDYHVENLIWMPGEAGLKQCGLLDFQAAMIGPQPYDLVNLLEDARINVPQDIQKDILSGYDENYRAWLRILGTQFHCRVIGLFVKLPVMAGKMKYVEHIPRLQHYLYEGLQDPLLLPIRRFFDDLGVDFNSSEVIDMANVMAYVRTEK